MQSDTIKDHFFIKVAGVLIFDKVKFQDFVSNKAFLPDSYTDLSEPHRAEGRQGLSKPVA